MYRKRRMFECTAPPTAFQPLFMCLACMNESYVPAACPELVSDRDNSYVCEMECASCGHSSLVFVSAEAVESYEAWEATHFVEVEQNTRKVDERRFAHSVHTLIDHLGNGNVTADDFPPPRR